MENIAVDYDPNIGYETNSFVKKVFNGFFIPFLNILPSGIRGLVKKTNVSAKEIIETATSHYAIEILYKHGESHRSRNLIQRFFHYVWFSTNNPKAVRNRLRLVKREVSNAIRNHIKNGDDVSILSIASGSARAIVETLDNPEFLNRKIFVSFLDKSDKAINYSKSMTKERDFPENYSFRWIMDEAKSFQNYYEGEIPKPNIIETVGLMDYFTDEKVLEFFSHIYKNLEPEGVFITANVADNPERKFVTNLVGWKMIYREPEKFLRIAVEAGFKDENIKILFEPLKIHFVMIAKK